MITTICLNPCFDKTVNVDSLQVGQVNRIRDARVDLGTRGWTLAVKASTLPLSPNAWGLMFSASE